MWKKRKYALALCVGTWLMANGAFAEDSLSLGEATRKTLVNHAALQVFSYREAALMGRRQTSALRPGYELGAELENFAGSGTTNGIDDAELTVSLSSVIELGSKRQVRLASIDARAGLLEMERQVQALDVLGAMTTQFIAVMALQQRLVLAKESEALAKETTATVTSRVDAGAAPDAELLRARAMQSQAGLTVSQIERELEVAKVALASFWGERRTNTSAAEGNLFNFGTSIEFETLYQRSVDSPGMQIYASQERLQDSAVKLAKSRSKSDLRWSLGVRRLAGPSDTALVASIEMPLFSGRRNRGDVAAAMAERNEVPIRREQALNELYARLFDGYLTRIQSIEASRTLQGETIPALAQALATTRRAYESGRYGYLDLIAAQQALVDAKTTLIDTASAALQAGVIIEQLTGLSLADSDAAQQLRKEHVR
ncbi:MAG: TolC family protein [Pseudomonadales bacterium]